MLPGCINFIGASASNNGLTGKISNNTHLHPAGTITVTYNGSVGECFYQTERFWASDDVNVLYPKFEMNEQIALFFLAPLSKKGKGYGYAFKWTKEKMENDSIELPIKSNGEIDFDFIESRIRELKESRIRELEAYFIAAGFEDCTLTQSERDALNTFENGTFDYVCIGDLYDKVKLNNKKFNKRTDAAKERSKTFSVPLVNAKHGDNGIMFYGRKEVFDTVSSSIAIIQNGAVATGDVYPQPEPTSVLWDAYLIKSLTDCDTENSLFYIAAAIQKTIKLKYNYDKKATWERVKTESVYLPLTNHGDIDYDFIENYVNAIKKQCIAALKQEISREHKAYEKAVGIDPAENETEKEESKIIVLPTYREGCVPLYTLRAACGYFEGGELPEEEGWIDATDNGFTPDPTRHFAVHAKGNSMQPKIQDGDICVFEWYKAGTRNGEIVLTECNEKDLDYGGQYTIKKYHSEKHQTEDGWQHTKIELIPLNNDYDTIELDNDTDYRTIGVLKCVINNES